MPVYGNCNHCGAPISMPPSQWARSQEHFCSRQCHMAKMNAELNPTRMTKEVRQKLALSRLNTGSWPSRSWAARCSPVKSSTTSTATKETTDLKTFACSAAKPSTPGGTKKTTRR